jgi:hypothetical protein
MKQIQLIIVLLVMFLFQGCDNSVDPQNVPSSLLLDNKEYLFDSLGLVIDKKLNEDQSYKTEIKLSFGEGNQITFTLNSANDRTFNMGRYLWATEDRNGTITAVSVIISGISEAIELTSQSFSVEYDQDQYIISFELSGEIEVRGTFMGELEFQERYVKGTGSFDFGGESYNIPYFGLSDIIQTADGFFLARLYFYNVDPSNPFLRDQRSHSLYLTIAQVTDEQLQPGYYSSSASTLPFRLVEGKPILATGYQFVSGNATFSSQDDLYNVSFSLTVDDGENYIPVTGTYSGVINRW